MKKDAEQEKYLKELFSTVDWKGISDKHIRQIKHEVEHWYSDYYMIQYYKEKLGEEPDVPFSDKFNKWIDKRIQMNIYD